MVTKKAIEPNEEYLTRRAIKKKASSLYSHAKTRELNNTRIEDPKQTIIKEEKSKLDVFDFDEK